MWINLVTIWSWWISSKPPYVVDTTICLLYILALRVNRYLTEVSVMMLVVVAIMIVMTFLVVIMKTMIISFKVIMIKILCFSQAPTAPWSTTRYFAGDQHCQTELYHSRAPLLYQVGLLRCITANSVLSQAISIAHQWN